MPSDCHAVYTVSRLPSLVLIAQVLFPFIALTHRQTHKLCTDPTDHPATGSVTASEGNKANIDLEHRYYVTQIKRKNQTSFRRLLLRLVWTWTKPYTLVTLPEPDGAMINMKLTINLSSRIDLHIQRGSAYGIKNS